MTEDFTQRLTLSRHATDRRADLRTKPGLFDELAQDVRTRVIVLHNGKALVDGNVLVTLTSPHHMRPSVLKAARQNPDPRLAALPQPRVGMVLGGPSGVHRFEAPDIAALCAIAREILASGQGLMVTPSRRTPDELVKALRTAVQESGSAASAFIWDGTGDNPYAQALVVTADSVNMVGEAASTGAPVFVYEPTGGAAKMSGFISKLVDAGALRLLPPARALDWSKERWSYPPVDATGLIADEVVRRYRAFRGI